MLYDIIGIHPWTGQIGKQMHELLSGLNRELARYLDAQLSRRSENYWETHVLPELTDHQRNAIRQRGYNRLSQLDVAALLRVFDRNWFEVSAQGNLPREGRNWLKELQAVRNKWAHAGVEEPPAADVYRDADTMLRFMTMIDAEKGLLASVENQKSEALTQLAASQATPGPQAAARAARKGAGRRGSVYDPLRDFLENRISNHWHASFSEIEDLLGRPLPASAFKYPAWWANQSRDNPVQAKSWMSVGWRVDAVDFERQTVAFNRV